MNAPSTPLSLSPGKCAIAYREGRHEQLAQVFIDLLDKFRATTYYDIDARTAHFVNVFTKNFLFYFTQEDFAVSEPLLLRFIESNAVICNVVGMSHFRTTDAHVRLLLEQGHNFAKVLALYNPRCTVNWTGRRYLPPTQPSQLSGTTHTSRTIERGAYRKPAGYRCVNTFTTSMTVCRR